MTHSNPLGPVATLSELEEGPKRVTVEEKTFLIYETADEVRAFRNVCPHQFGPVLEGRLDAGRVICPWHGWEFDLETGRNPYDGEIGRLPQATTVVEDGHVYLEL